VVPVTDLRKFRFANQTIQSREAQQNNIKIRQSKLVGDVHVKKGGQEVQQKNAGTEKVIDVEVGQQNLNSGN
jgi:hypothetical protein